MMHVYLYFDSRHAVLVHDSIISLTGGLDGILHPNLLESCLEFIKDDGYYPEMSDKLCHLMFSLAKNHIFKDGNKRSSLALGAYFLGINGYQLLIGTFITEMENIVLWVADGKIHKEDFKVILESFLIYGYINQESKALIIHLLNASEECA